VVHPGAVTFAEEATAFDGVTRSTEDGGLGFDFKWDLGWTSDTLSYLRTDPIHRSGRHEQLTFRSVYADSEAFCLPLSHDEVAHGKGSLLEQMPGDRAQQLATLRLLLTYQFTLPGKKLVFMGAEFAAPSGWEVEDQLPWPALDEPAHARVRDLTRALAHRYRDLPALHRGDARRDGFAWVDGSDRDHSVVSYLRQADGADDVLVVLNFTPVVRSPYRIGVPHGGAWREVLNSDDERFGGAGTLNGTVEADDIEVAGRPASLELALPALGGAVFVPVRR